LKVSVVIPTLNEQEYLPKCIESLRAQTVSCEIVVADSKSSDGTLEIAEKLADVVVREGKKNIAFNRQIGLEASSCDIVVSTDADCIFPNDWLERILGRFEDPRVVAVSGPTIPIPGESNSFDNFCYFTGNIGLWILHKLGVVWFRGSNSGYRKSAVLDAGGYDVRMHAREDSDLSQRVSRFGVTVFDWDVKVMTSMRRRKNLGWRKALRYYIDTPISLVSGKQYYEKV